MFPFWVRSWIASSASAVWSQCYRVMKPLEALGDFWTLLLSFSSTKFARAKENSFLWRSSSVIQKWLDVCFKRNKNGKVPITQLSQSFFFFFLDVIAKAYAPRGRLQCSAAKMHHSWIEILYCKQWLKNVPFIFYELHIDFIFPLISLFPHENMLVWKEVGGAGGKLVLQVSWW